jgi:hypothetical protein
MKVVSLALSELLLTITAHGQGYFVFNTRNTDFGEVVRFVDWNSGFPVSRDDCFVMVFAGSSFNSLKPLGDPLALNRTGTEAGLTNPFLRTYTTDLPAGGALIGYQAFQGGSFENAVTKSVLITTKLGSDQPLRIVLVEAPNLPNELTLGSGSVAVFVIPEPSSLALGLIGLAAVLLLQQCRRKWVEPVS